MELLVQTIQGFPLSHTKSSSKSVEPFRRSLVTYTCTEEIYIYIYIYIIVHIFLSSYRQYNYLPCFLIYFLFNCIATCFLYVNYMIFIYRFQFEIVCIEIYIGIISSSFTIELYVCTFACLAKPSILLEVIYRSIYESFILKIKNTYSYFFIISRLSFLLNCLKLLSL